MLYTARLVVKTADDMKEKLRFEEMGIEYTPEVSDPEHKMINFNWDDVSDLIENTIDVGGEEVPVVLVMKYNGHSYAVDEDFDELVAARAEAFETKPS